jgi:hypothetical protein
MGWMNYYGHFDKSALYGPLAQRPPHRHIIEMIVKSPRLSQGPGRSQVTELTYDPS